MRRNRPGRKKGQGKLLLLFHADKWQGPSKCKSVTNGLFPFLRKAGQSVDFLSNVELHLWKEYKDLFRIEGLLKSYEIGIAVGKKHWRSRSVLSGPCYFLCWRSFAKKVFFFKALWSVSQTDVWELSSVLTFAFEKTLSTNCQKVERRRT